MHCARAQVKVLRYYVRLFCFSDGALRKGRMIWGKRGPRGKVQTVFRPLPRTSARRNVKLH